MDRRSWLWRRKSSEKSPGETESSVGSISSHSERFSDDQVYLNQNYQSVEVTLKNDIHQSEHNNHEVKTLSEKLSEALVSINAKEELVKQHVKVAEEAVSGWEKSEREVSGLKQQLEALTIKNSTLEDRVIHLDGALKECLRQLRQTREEKDQIAHEALEKKISETESSLTSMDTEIYHKLEMIEKENSDLKLELSSMAEELEIRLIEKELSNQAAEEASKQYLDSVKKIAQLETECHRWLNLSTPKKARKPPFITENGGFGKFGRKRMDSSVEIGLMDDFLEMEKLAGMPENSEVEERIKKVENELKVLRNRLKEAECKLDERENELSVSKSRIEEVESKLVDLENELKASRNRVEESEYKLVESENEVKDYRNRLEEAEFELGEYENELKASRNRVEESESKLNECQTELKASKNRLEEYESKLNDCENELNASRNRLEVYESKLNDREKELEASRNQFKEAEFKLKEHENEFKCAESELAKTDDRLEEAESRCKALETELEMLLSKVEYLENDVQKERDLSRKAEAKCRELENEVSRLKHEDEGTRSGNRAEELRLLKVKQEMELAVAGSKFAECKKTIDSLNRQLKTLATLDDFLIDITDS